MKHAQPLPAEFHERADNRMLNGILRQQTLLRDVAIYLNKEAQQLQDDGASVAVIQALRSNAKKISDAALAQDGLHSLIDGIHKLSDPSLAAMMA